MTTYLTIAITLLLLAEIIRIIQNVLALNKNSFIHKQNDYIISVYRKIEYWLDKQEEEK